MNKNSHIPASSNVIDETQENSGRNSESPDRPYYFIVTFWGVEFRSLFLDVCLASLLAPGNIPALRDKTRSKFIIATTAEDWEAIQSHPLMERLRCQIEPVAQLLPPPTESGNTYVRMSTAHLAGASAARNANACGIFICPDALLSDGAVAWLQDRVDQGCKCVMIPGVRYNQEDILSDLSCDGWLRVGHPLAIPPRALTAIGLRHFHFESARWEWDSPFFDFFPVGTWWKAPLDDGVILHSHSMAPILVDYGRLPDHDTKGLEQWTLDGDYAYRNFGENEDVVLVTDSDDIAYVTLTPKQSRTEPLIVNRNKVTSLRSIHFGPIQDPLRRRLFLTPIRLHTADLTAAWEHKEREVQAELDKILSPRLSLIERARAGSLALDTLARRLGYWKRTFANDPIGFVTRRARKYLRLRRSAQSK